MRKMTRCFLSTGSINGIDLYMAGIKMHFYPPPISYLDQSNILKSVLYMEKSAIGQQIIPSKSMITRKRSLMIIIPSIGPGQIMNKLYNTGSPILKVLRIMMNVLLNILEIYQFIYTMTIRRNLSHFT